MNSYMSVTSFNSYQHLANFIWPNLNSLPFYSWSILKQILDIVLSHQYQVISLTEKDFSYLKSHLTTVTIISNNYSLVSSDSAYIQILPYYLDVA